MDPLAKKSPRTHPEDGLYDGVDIEGAEDVELALMKETLRGLFHDARDGANIYGEYSGQRAMVAVGAATGYAAICTEQRERKILRAHQNHFKRK